jgi:hypothetical protein
MKQEIMGFWRQIKGRCDKCHRIRDKMYEVREGPVTGRFCSRFCYEQAVKDKEAEKGSVDEKVKELKEAQKNYTLG